MGKQISFYLDEQMKSQLEEFLSANNFVQLSASASVIRVSEESDHIVCLYKETYGTLLFTKWKTPQIDIIKSPVIRFKKPVIEQDKHKIICGRFWVADKYVSESGTLIQKNAQLIKDYQKLVRWIRKNVMRREIPTGNTMVMQYACQSLDKLLEYGFFYTI